MRLPESGLLAEEEYVDYLDEPTSLDNIASGGVSPVFAISLTGEEAFELDSDLFYDDEVIGSTYYVTETFLIGGYESKVEAENLAIYIQTKFVRVLVSILKATPNNTRETWSKVPLQDFMPQSDIDWTQSIPDIERQLFDKYGLDEKEIAFIEEKLKPIE